MEYREFYIKYLDHQPVPIDISYGRGAQGTLPLVTVAHLIGAFQALPNSPLANAFVGDIALHLPYGFERSALSKECFASDDANDITLRSGLALTQLNELGSDDFHPLIIKSMIDAAQGMFHLTDRR